jgi:glucose-6-phosphate dehydrogenase assembly protein OpcA
VAGRWQRRCRRQRAFAGEFIEHAAQGDLARQFEGVGNDVIVSAPGVGAWWADDSAVASPRK